MDSRITKGILLASMMMFVSGVASATDGYFAPGYGVQSVGMGGVAIALPLDTQSAVSNPAGMAWVGNRLDFGLTLFRPQRFATLSMPSGSMTFAGNKKSNFLIPEFGYNRMITPKLALGIVVFGNGGMNTGYSNLNSATRGAQCANPQVLQMFGGSAQACMASPVGQMGAFGVGSAGVDLQQLFISPTIAYRLNDSNTIGISLNFVHQSFDATGIQAFQGMSSNPQNLTNRGHAGSDGVGFRIGWMGKLTKHLTLGLTYQPKTHMSRFNKYNGLFAGGGSFDIPASYGAGVAWKPDPQLTVAADIVRIEYGDVPSISNPMINSMICPNPSSCGLGTAAGTGFGWRSVTVTKLGVQYVLNRQFTLRAGWNHSGQPVPSSAAFINVLAPGVEQNHVTLGATYRLNADMALSFDYVHAMDTKVTGSGASQGTSIHMYQDVVGVSLGWKY